MLRRLDASHDNVIGYSLAGDVTSDDYRQAASELKDVIAQHGSVRVLFRLADLSPQSFLSALDDGFAFVKEEHDSIDRIALVSDEGASDLLSRLTGAVSSIDLRHFSRDDEQTAWAWLE